MPFAREPERRKVGIDARITVDGVSYEVDPDLAGETVVLWWGLFDNELYVEAGERRYGPYTPVGAPIPLHCYRSFKKTRTQQRADKIESLAKELVLPATVIGQVDLFSSPDSQIELRVQSFVDPDRVRVALEPKCTLTTDSCDNDKIFTFFNASFSSIFQALSVFFL
jgi:hypothetical protein